MINKRFVFFAATRYWSDFQQLLKSFEEWKDQLRPIATECRLIVDGKDMESLIPEADDILIIVPMSGAVQKDILQAAEKFDAVVLYAGYVQGNASDQTTRLMTKYNAAPTLMDSWSVLRKRNKKAMLALHQKELELKLRTIAAFQSLQKAKLLLIGDPEPWVVSVSRDLDDYRKLGFEIVQIAQQEIAELYAHTTDEEGRQYFEKYKLGAQACVGPDEDDLKNAARMTATLMKTLTKYQADGVAIACFNLLSSGTTSCLGVSYINDCTDKVAACEGDLDSAVTMLMLKRLTRTDRKSVV